MSDSEPVDDFGQFILLHYSQGTLEEITNWIERKIIVCSPTPTSSIFNFSHGVKKVLVTLIQAANFEAVVSLWRAIVGREFRAEQGACPVRTPSFRSHVCYTMAQVILATEEYTRSVEGIREQLGSFLRAAILDHQYVNNPAWIANLRDLCRRALLCVGFEDSDNELLRILEVQEEISRQHPARPEAPPQRGRRSSQEAQGEAPGPIMYCPKHKQQLLLLSLGIGERRPSDASHSGEQDSSSSVSSVQDQASPVIDSPTESGERRPSNASQAGEQDISSSEPSTPNPASPVIVIDSSTESGELGPIDAGQAEDQDSSNLEPSVPHRASPEVVVIDSSTESSGGPLDLRVHDVAGISQQAGGSESGELEDGQFGKQQKLDSDTSD